MKTPSMKKLANCLMLFVFAAAMLACSKDSDDPKPETPSGNAVEGTWKIKAMNVDPAQNGVTDVLAFYEALTGKKCLSETEITFKSNGTVGAKVPIGCDDVIDDVDIVDDASKWTVKDKKIILTEGTDVTEFDLETSATEMKWSTTEEEDGVKYKMTIVFKKS
ncbi:hypothetical protein GCM10010967_07290 [Dyadobacter beijingensis]|uniref:Lipocalin-like domain-containing protein n=1 Tax=Dyadobacter beijingensis TaxID=365489 RepID=A0ABQ2HFY4_9BACT|nr:lipocalin family protein [Dyadobacter beijingensis]GGM78128.1 hypothetical protein GCM10010967_07290 [Dyadobacter beijingensis]